MPFKKWLEMHDLNLIMPLFYETQTSQGYGYIEEVPTYYGRPNPPQRPGPPAQPPPSRPQCGPSL